MAIVDGVNVREISAAELGTLRVLLQACPCPDVDMRGLHTHQKVKAVGLIGAVIENAGAATVVIAGREVSVVTFVLRKADGQRVTMSGTALFVTPLERGA